MTGSTARREGERRRLEAGVNRHDDGARAASKVRAPQQAILSSGSRRFEVSEGWEVHRASELLAPRMRLYLLCSGCSLWEGPAATPFA